jgi:hypothetical protein
LRLRGGNRRLTMPAARWSIFNDLSESSLSHPSALPARLRNRYATALRPNATKMLHPCLRGKAIAYAGSLGKRGRFCFTRRREGAKMCCACGEAASSNPTSCMPARLQDRACGAAGALRVFASSRENPYAIALPVPGRNRIRCRTTPDHRSVMDSPMVLLIGLVR